MAQLSFSVGRYVSQTTPPDIKIEEPTVDIQQVNNILNSSLPQSETLESNPGVVAGETFDPNCAGKIKGNIGSSGRIYHIPGGSFYERTIPEMCFNTETEAQAAGFRKSQR